MTTQEIDKYLEKLVNLENLVRKRRNEGFAQAVLAIYEVRLGDPTTALATAVERAGDRAELQRLLEIVSTLSAKDVAAALRKPRPKPGARAKGSRRGASARRASISR